MKIADKHDARGVTSLLKKKRTIGKVKRET